MTELIIINSEKKIKVNKKILWGMIMTFALIEPPYFATIDTIDKIYEVVKILVSIIIIAKSVFARKISSYTIKIIIFQGWLLLTTILNQRDVRSVFLQTAYLIVFCLATDLNLGKHMKEHIYSIYYVLEIYAIVNLISYIFNPRGLYFNYWGWPCYFLGYRNIANQFLLPMMVLSVLYSCLEYHRIRVTMRVVFDILCCFLFAVFTRTSTGMASCVVFILTLFIRKVLNGVGTTIKLKWIVIVGSIFSFLLVVINIQEYLNKVLDFIFQKDSSLSGRTDLWTILILMVIQKPIMGMGVVDSLSEITHIYWANQAHNQFLQVLVQGGVLGLSFFLILLWSSFSKVDRIKNINLKEPFILFGIVYMIAFQMEAYIQPIFYIILMLAHNIDVLEEEMVNGKKAHFTNRGRHTD